MTDNQDDAHLPIVSEAHVFNIDYFDLAQVKTLARKMGPGHTVYQHPERLNYNIRHTSRECELPQGTKIFLRT